MFSMHCSYEFIFNPAPVYKLREDHVCLAIRRQWESWNHESVDPEEAVRRWFIILIFVLLVSICWLLIILLYLLVLFGFGGSFM